VQFVQGEIFYPDDDPEERAVYHGQVCHGLPWGNGTMTWSFGATYNGEWFNGKRHGTGSYTYKPEMSNKLPFSTDLLDFHVTNPHENLHPLFRLFLSKNQAKKAGNNGDQDNIPTTFEELDKSEFVLEKSNEDITKPLGKKFDADLEKSIYQLENSGEKDGNLGESFIIKLMLNSKPEQDNTQLSTEIDIQESNSQKFTENDDNNKDDVDIYIGSWENDKMHGKGIYIWSKSNTVHAKYEGGFSGGLKSGHGKETWKSGQMYEGSFVGGLKDGFGILDFSANKKCKFLKYIGTFKDDDLSGLGTLTWKNGDVYRGHFENGTMHGSGQMYWHDNPDLEEANGLTESNGLTGSNGLTYQGEWKEGFMDGHGVLTFHAKSPLHTFEGTFVEEKMTNGVLWLKNGDKKVIDQSFFNETVF